MSFHTTAAACGCVQTAPLPENVQQLVLQGGVAIDICLEELALFGTSLDNAIIMTSNANAIVQGRGGYAGYQSVGQRLRLNPRRPVMRMADARDMLVMLSPACAEAPAALSVIATDGRIQHRVQVAGADWNRVETLPHSGIRAAPVVDGPATSSNVIVLHDVRHRRENWATATIGMCLDDVLHDAGRVRLRCLPHVRAGARRVKPQLLYSFISFLCERRVCLAATVFAEGMSQTISGTSRKATTMGRFIICETDSGRFALDPDGVAHAWICRHGAAAHLELYNKSGVCIAVLHAPPSGDWSDYLEAFPGA